MQPSSETAPAAFARRGRDRGAVDEGLALRAGEERVTALGKHAELRGVVGDDGENDVGRGGDLGERARALRADLGGERIGAGGMNIVDRGDGVTAIFEPASHVGSHATDSHEGNALRTHEEK
jgi:hypothetical protein